jgi:uncharacterized protein YyaL (SSP411 family)
LRHSWRAGRLQHPATLDDYANMSRAALLLLEATGDDAYLAQAAHWASVVEQYYSEPGKPGYLFAASDTPGLIVRNRTASDNPTPSGNGVMVEVLARLWLLTGKDAYRQAADTVVAAFSGELARNFFPLSTLLNATEFLFAPVQVVLIGDRDDPQAAAMLQALAGVSVPNQVVQTVPPGDTLPDGHPAQGKSQIDGAATVYVCHGQTCSLPITDPDALAAALAGG